MPVTFKGDGLVAVWHSHPKWGDPMEGVFYLKPPYTDAQRDRAFEQRGVQWLKLKERGGYRPTTKPDFRGPFLFEDVRRHDLGETRRSDDEYVIVAWFKRDKPEVLTIEDIHERRELLARYGITPPEPVRYMRDPAPGVNLPVADEFGEYRDPNGRAEGGVLYGQ